MGSEYCAVPHEAGWLQDHLFSTAAVATSAGILTLIKIATEWRAEEAALWLSDLRNAEHPDSTWEASVARFHRADTASLMATYYRGVPRMIGIGFSNAENPSKSSDWVLELLNRAQDASRRLAETLGDDPDRQKRHRAQVFPIIPAVQCLSVVDPDTARSICNLIATLLRESQRGAGSFTESAADQISQIVSQVLTDQLLAGPHAWRTFAITDELLLALMAPANSSDTAQRFSAGLGLTAQFLAYYRKSLAMRERYIAASVGQYQRIEDFFNSLAHKSPAVFSKNLAPYASYFRRYAEKATPARNRPIHRSLIRQTSAALMSHHHCEGLSDELVGVCLLTNLRAASNSLALGDDVRVEAIHSFLGSNGITRRLAHAAAKTWLDEADASTARRAHEFAELLPVEAPPKTATGATFATSTGTTIDEIVEKVRTLQRTPSKIEAVPELVSKLIFGSRAQVASEMIYPIVKRLATRANVKRQKRLKDVRALVEQALAEDEAQ